jgi:hypothetical protein
LFLRLSREGSNIKVKYAAKNKGNLNDFFNTNPKVLECLPYIRVQILNPSIVYILE